MPSCSPFPTINGEVSILFQDLIDLGFDVRGAKEIYRYVKSKAYVERMGDWMTSPETFTGTLTSQGEPTLESVIPEAHLRVLREHKRALRKIPETLASTMSEIKRHIEVPVPETEENALRRIQKEVARRILANVRSQIDLLKDRDAPKARLRRAEMEAEIQRLQDLLIRGETERVLIEYTERVVPLMREGHKNVKRALQEGKYTPVSVYQLQEYVRAFGVLPDVRKAIMDDPELRSKFEGSIVRELDEAIKLKSEVESDLEVMELEASVRRIAPLIESVESRWRAEILRRFKDSLQDTELEAPEIEARRRAFLAEELEKNRDLIEAEKREEARRMLTQVPRDISWIEQMLDPIQDVRDEVLQIQHDRWQRGRSEARSETEEVNRLVKTLWEQLAEYKGNPSDQKKLYEEMLDGVYLVGKYEARFIEEREKMEEETRILDSDTFEEAEEKRRKKSAWYREHAEREFTEDFYKIWDHLFEGANDEQRRIQLEIDAKLKPYRRYGEDNFYDEIPVTLAEEIKELEVKKKAASTSKGFMQRLHSYKNPDGSLRFRKLEDFVSFVPTEKYERTKAEMQMKTKEEYEAWYRANHHGTEPLRHWTQPVATDPAHRNERFIPGMVTPKEKYRSKKYEALMALPPDHPVRAFWEMARRETIRADKVRPLGKRLSERIGDDHFVRLLGKRAEYVERKESQGLFKSIWENIKEGLSIQEGDEDVVDTFGVAEGPEGTIRKVVPVYFQKKLPEKDQSFDVASLIVMNRWVSSNYHHMSKIAPEMEVIYSVLKKRRVMHEKKGKIITGRTSGAFLDKPEDDVRATKLLRSFLDSNIYGEKTKDDWLSPNSQKRIELFQRYVSTTLLSGNVIAGLQNVTNGMVNMMFEAMGGGRYGVGEFAEAHKKYIADFITGRLFADIGKLDKESRTNLLSLEFDALNDWRGSRLEFARNNIWKRSVNANALHGVNTMTEHFIQHVGMYAVLGEIKVLGEDGQYIGRDGNPTMDRAKAMSLDEAYERTGRDRLSLRPDVKQVELRDGRVLEWNDDARYRIKRMIWDLSKEMFGAYSPQNENMAQRWIMGRLLHTMRKWIRTTAARRYGGVFRIGKALEEDTSFERLATVRYNYQTGEFVEGYYTTLFRVLRKMVRDARSDSVAWTASWYDLTDYEKGNIRKAVTDLGLAVLMGVVVAPLLEAWAEDDEEDDTWKWLLAYQGRRLFTELSFYWFPPEMLTILRHPMPTATMLENISKLVWQLGTDPMERYERGTREGELKIWKRSEDILPFYQQYTRFRDLRESVEFLQSWAN